MAYKADIQQLITEKQRRLQKLKLRAARYGIDTPPQISIEIEDTEAELDKLQSQLLDAEEVAPDTPAQPAARAGKSGSAYNIGSIQAGQVNFDSQQKINDQTINMDFSETHVTEGSTLVQGDQFNLSGNFQGANVNVKSTLDDVCQTINNAPHIDPAERAELQELLGQLNAVLQQIPANKSDEAETVAEMAADLVEMAAKEKPNKTKAQITASGLKQAAENLAKVLPPVLPLATQIAMHVAKLIK